MNMAIYFRRWRGRTMWIHDSGGHLSPFEKLTRLRISEILGYSPEPLSFAILKISVPCMMNV